MAQLIEGFKEQWTFVAPVSDTIDVTNCFAAIGVKRDTMNALSFEMGRRRSAKKG